MSIFSDNPSDERFVDYFDGFDFMRRSCDRLIGNKRCSQCTPEEAKTNHYVVVSIEIGKYVRNEVRCNATECSWLEDHEF